jgi:hypothetical protein
VNTKPKYLTRTYSETLVDPEADDVPESVYLLQVTEVEYGGSACLEEIRKVDGKVLDFETFKTFDAAKDALDERAWDLEASGYEIQPKQVL